MDIGNRTPIILDNQYLRQVNPQIEAHFKACKAELDSFPTINGVIRDRSLVDWIACPVCNSEDTTQWLVKWGGRYEICKKCGHRFLKNPFKQAILLNLF